MTLSIVVTHYKTPELLKLCLNSLKIAGADLDYEIMVLDSDVADEETQEMIEAEFPDIKYFPFKKNTGYAKIVNIGLAKAQGEFILVLNADIIVEPDSLKKMVEYLADHKDIWMLGPQLLNFNGTIQESCFRFHKISTILLRRTFLGKTRWGQKELARFLMKDFDRQSAREIDWILGAALMVKRQALERVGLMDEQFFLYFEDTDWCRRFWKKGLKVVYFPEARMHHYHGRFSKKTSGLMDLFVNKYTWIHIFSAIKYFWKYRGKLTQENHAKINTNSANLR